MTEDQRKKYEEAARAYTDNLGDDPPDHRDIRSAYCAGAEFASQDTEERLKQAHNEACRLQDENKRLRDEIRDLKAWKTSEIEIWSPVITYAQQNAERLRIKLGSSISEYVLNLMEKQ